MKSRIASVLADIGEHFASGYYEQPGASTFTRWSRAHRRYFEHRRLSDVHPDAPFAPSLVAATGSGKILKPSYSFSWIFDPSELDSAIAVSGHGDDVRNVLEFLGSEFREHEKTLNCITSPHTVGGRGYTHSIPNYGRILREGLNSYERRITENDVDVDKHLAEDAGASIYSGLRDLIQGIREWHSRIVGKLSANAGSHKLVQALNRVPFLPARSFYEALVSYNFIYYIDGCDNPGRFDQELIGYYRNDISSNIINEADALDLIRSFFENVDANSGWSLGIGGTAPDGKNGYNELTELCLRAATGMRRPNLQLHVREDMPDIIWDKALDCIAAGSGLPSLYNDEVFDSALSSAGIVIHPEDRWRRNGGGCTETMMHGCSNVGSLDAGINLPLILSGAISRLAASNDWPTTFDSFVHLYLDDITTVVTDVTSQVNTDQRIKARLRPHPVRTLLVDDCVDTRTEFNAGGARYNWSVINVAGLANVADSLEAIRMEIYESGRSTFESLYSAISANFDGTPELRNRLASYPKYGNDIDSVDEIARSVGGHVFDELVSNKTWRGGKFLGSCIMFVTYGPAGGRIPATPDGRLAGTPLADSIGPVRGRDTHGPTAMLKSVASLPQEKAPGTLVANARFDRALFDSREGRVTLRGLIETYFELGGMQLQINTIDQETILDAINHPELHNDLIVRVGGYSEYFNRLSSELKHTLLERVEHSA